MGFQEISMPPCGGTMASGGFVKTMDESKLKFSVRGVRAMAQIKAPSVGGV